MLVHACLFLHCSGYSVVLPGVQVVQIYAAMKEDERLKWYM